MIDPTVAEALARLCDSETVHLRTREGTPVDLLVGTVAGELASGTASRAVVAPGMPLVGQIADELSGAWYVDLRVVRAEYATPDLAAVAVLATGVRPDDSRREEERVPAGGITWLVAIDCSAVEGGTRVEGSLSDLSRTGVSFVTPWPLLPGDRLMFHGRFFADEVNAEVVVASVRPSPLPGRRLAGCSFSELPELDRLRIDRILTMSGASRRPSGVDAGPLRAITGGQGDAADGGGRRLLFRRS